MSRSARLIAWSSVSPSCSSREADTDRRSLHRLGQRSREVTEARLRVHELGTHQRADELIAAVPHQHVVRPQASPHRRTQLVEHTVAVRMAVRIVDQFQMVDVDERHHQRFPDSVGAIDRRTELVTPCGPRQRTGEVVAVRAFELFGGVVAVERRFRTVERGRGPVLGGGDPIPQCPLRRRRVPGLGGLVASPRCGVALGGRSTHVVRSRPIGVVAREGFDRGRLLVHSVTGPSSAGSP